MSYAPDFSSGDCRPISIADLPDRLAYGLAPLVS
jgi:hypothetical protein